MFGMMRNPQKVTPKLALMLLLKPPIAPPYLMLFEGAIAAVSLARIHMEAGQIPQKGAAISKAIDLVINGLQASLDQEAGGELAERLARYMSTSASAFYSPIEKQRGRTR